ncbi:acyltransferase family protein [Sinorhizobium meliloti]|uniref:acyltransferase family protein n=1 Tax=Rhizobium meliloti TaxID=382 RepID=UPI000FD87183|nr:acyltransferase family protein [Sinorhizobium meliloti]RVG35354.1 acyltransferase [Sinorhizobium meliloti]
MHYRPEIDGLRAVAVIPVLLFHAGFGFISGGFAGVDVFFVISGFLITSLIHQEIRSGAFSIVAFYERRARRLAPALLFVCTVSIPFALMWMLPKELNEFGKSLYAANLFAANFFFWDQTNYFTPDTDLMPLLHTWSLAVEEQFYIVFPLLLLSLRRLSEATGLRVVVAATVLSFGATQLVARIDPAANFYLLPSRFWELGLGAAVALSGVANREFSRFVRECFAWGGLFLIAASYLSITDTHHYPGWATVPVVAGTALVLAFARGDTLIGRCLSARPLVAIGLCSYSLYLWHQPVFAFARLRTSDGVTPAGYAGLIVLCFGLAYLSWRYVEGPFRNRARLGRKAIFATVAAVGSITVATGLVLDGSDGLASRNVDLARLTKPSVGLGKDCNAVIDLKCSTSSEPVIAVWGDSFARHLVDGILASEPDARLVQLTNNNCGPLAGLAPIKAKFEPAWPQECIEHNKEVQRFLLAHKSIRDVVLSSPLSQYLEEETMLLDGKGVVPSGTRTVTGSYRASLAWLRQNGFWPVVVAPPPQDGRDTGLCVARARLLGTSAGDCGAPLANVQSHDRDVLSVLADIAGDYPVVSFTGYLCGAGRCRTEDRGVALFEDHGHFSDEGSRRLGAALRFYQAFAEAAEHGCAAESGEHQAPARGLCNLTDNAPQASADASGTLPARINTRSARAE